ncbi:phospholipase D-like domain-containing protein [Salipaludibacillus sp. HK11]|uniref:phospholipase D-like domain-containing protein n=1 Tax=Salipaludibacillus sp. HK11 TaxID=3394320 RepID=UPI0039FCE6D4
MKTIFLRPGECNTEATLSEIIKIIKHTDGLLRIAVAYFNHKTLIKELIERTELQKETRLILNTSDLLRPNNPRESALFVSKDLIDLINISQENHLLQIKSLGLNTRINYQNMHHKFVVSERQVIFGSLNWTYAALEKNFELIHICEDRDLAKEFQCEFDNLWETSQDIYTRYGKIRGIICPECISSDGVDFESYGPFCTICGHRFKFN